MKLNVLELITEIFRTLKINLETFNILSKSIPKDIIKICESGIDSNVQLNQFSTKGADAFLIGESLMKSSNIKKTQDLINR